jgi:hypothetical protein
MIHTTIADVSVDVGIGVIAVIFSNNVATTVSLICIYK